MPDECSNEKKSIKRGKGFLCRAWGELKRYRDQNPMGMVILIAWFAAVGGFWLGGFFTQKDSPLYLLGGALAVSAAFLRAKAMEQSVKLQSQGQVHERFRQAIEFLGGGTNNDALKILGGIYALDHIAREWQDEYCHPVFEILCGYLRNQGREGKPLTESERIILNLLFARNTIYQGLPANLTGANLSNVILSNAKMIKTNLSEAQIGGAEFLNAELYDSNLSNIIGCTSANFTGAILWKVNFNDSTLTAVNFSKAKFEKISFKCTKLIGVDFTGAEGLNPEMFYRVKKWKNVTGVPDNIVADIKKRNPNAFE